MQTIADETKQHKGSIKLIIKKLELMVIVPVPSNKKKGVI